MAVQVVAYWSCRTCEVEGMDAETEPRCWNCGESVIVTARPSVSADGYDAT